MQNFLHTTIAVQTVTQLPLPERQELSKVFHGTLLNQINSQISPKVSEELLLSTS